MNHLLLNVRMYLANSAPAGNTKRNAMVHMIPCAIINFCVGVKRTAVEDVDVDDVELEPRGLVRSRVSGPAPMCILMVASMSEDDGAVLLKAHTTFC